MYLELKRIINKYKKAIITSVIMSILSAIIYIGIDIIMFEFTAIRTSYEFDIVFEVIIQLLILLIGLIFYYKIDLSNFSDELKKGLIITILYSFSMGEFHQIINPASEPQSLFEKLILDLKHNWILIIAGIGIVFLKYVYKRLKATK